jgi:hypothetical protein
MNSIQLYSALKSQNVTRSFFSGVYSYDTILLIKKKPKLIICNTDPSYREGEHWVLFFFDKNTVDFFDPLGKSISYYGQNFIIFIKRFAKYYEINKRRVQPLYSSLCGQYCLYYAFLRCKGFKMNFIMKSFPTYFLVSKYVRNKFSICFKSVCFDNNCKRCIKCV